MFDSTNGMTNVVMKITSEVSHTKDLIIQSWCEDLINQKEIEVYSLDELLKRLQKCSRYEKLEREVGIPLDEFLNEIVGNTVYFIENGIEEFLCITGIGIKPDREYAGHEDVQKYHKRSFVILTDSCHTLEPNEYKKTWFLSHEGMKEVLKSGWSTQND